MTLGASTSAIARELTRVGANSRKEAPGKSLEPLIDPYGIRSPRFPCYSARFPGCSEERTRPQLSGCQRQKDRYIFLTNDATSIKPRPAMANQKALSAMTPPMVPK